MIGRKRAFGSMGSLSGFGRVCAVFLMGIVGVCPASAQGRAARAEYNRDVRPILAENCFICHGTDTSRRQAGLRLDMPESAYGKLASGRVAVVPGSLSASEIIERITARDARQMPPVYSNKKLTPAQIETLKRWIQAGGKYAPQWSYIRPERPALPEVKNPSWCLNPLDRFLLARLEQEGLHPSLTADRRTLIRRLSQDLTGLPPTPPEIEAFVSDRSSNAYGKLVDRLLASPHYGERMAEYWLDLVRYADTVGYHGDQDVIVWPYRDYVIRAFNRNKPFDVFTREQLAGDLLPNASQETRVASGYNRLGMMSAEGGVQEKEYLAKYVAERIRNASTVWMASTMGCCECHNHKFDPFTQKDFYSFGAFFADLKERGLYDGGVDWGPSMRLPTAEQKARLEKLETDIAAVKKTLDAVSNDTLAAGRAKWEVEVRARDTAHTLAWEVAKPLTAVSSGGSTLTIQQDGSVLASGKLPAFDTYTVTLPSGARPIAAIRLEVLPDGSLPGDDIARASTYFVLSEVEIALQNGNTEQPVKPVSVNVNDESEGYPGIALLDGRPDTGWAQVHPRVGVRTAVFHLAAPLPGGPDTKLIVRLRQETNAHHELGKFRISLSDRAQVDGSGQTVPDKVLDALRKETGKRSADESALIAAHYRTVAPELEETRRRLQRLDGERLYLLGAIPMTLVAEATAPRTMRVLPRGNWMDDSGEIVTPSAPHFLRQIVASGRATRLDLANWITAPDNPLTARVFVNRLWKLFFGVGLAKNLDDFGVQGEAPVHPELLDWLATEFVRSGWDVKHIVRLMVSCNAYRQTSTATPELLARDPFNRLVARQSAYRLDAEFVHDLALDAAGLLSGRVGGPSVYPYEPHGYLAALNFPRREWATGAGESLYRRGLYTQWQRTFLHPSLLAFDAPTREESTCTRTVSNTPMQALVLMNDPIFVEAARVFAARIVREGGATLDRRVDFAFRTALGRPPWPQETAILRTLYHRQLARYAADRQAARGLISTGDWPVAKDLDPVELAAWTSIARAILNLHETITRS